MTFSEMERMIEFLLTSHKSHDDQIAALVEQNAALSAKFDVLTERMIQAMETVNRLAHIAISHDERLDNL